jgi:hypothetical protein
VVGFARWLGRTLVLALSFVVIAVPISYLAAIPMFLVFELTVGKLVPGAESLSEIFVMSLVALPVALVVALVFFAPPATVLAVYMSLRSTYGRSTRGREVALVALIVGLICSLPYAFVLLRNAKELELVAKTSDHLSFGVMYGLAFAAGGMASWRITCE